MKKRVMISCVAMIILQLYIYSESGDPFPANFIASQAVCGIWFTIILAITGRIIAKTPEHSHKIAMYFRIAGSAYAATQGVPMLIYTMLGRSDEHIANTSWFWNGVQLAAFINFVVLVGLYLRIVPNSAYGLSAIVNFVLCIAFAINSENERPHL